jgi:hypothetical protein
MHRPNDRARNERFAGYLTSPDALVPGYRHFCLLLESALALKLLAPSLRVQRFRESVFKILLASCFRLLSVMLGVLFCRFRSVMRGMVQVTLSGVRVVSCRFVIA